MKWWFPFLTSLAVVGIAQANDDVERLILSGEQLVGVVFEIVEGEDDALEWALPQVGRLSKRLRERFPGLDVAVVTHGSEQFGLLSSRKDGPLSSIHTDAIELSERGVSLHVCGAHAGWYGHDATDFPSYVDVSASGPAQLNDYANLGYEVVRLEQESTD